MREVGQSTSHVAACTALSPEGTDVGSLRLFNSAFVSTSCRAAPWQGTVKGALARVREGAAARARELEEEALAQQERLDAARHTGAERTEDAAVLQEQARLVLITVLMCTDGTPPCCRGRRVCFHPVLMCTVRGRRHAAMSLLCTSAMDAMR